MRNWEGEETSMRRKGWRNMNNDFNVLRTTFPGIQWDGGQTVAYFNNHSAALQPMTRSQWGKGKAPYSLVEPCNAVLG